YLVAPIKTVYDVVLIAHVSRVFPDPPSQLNSAEENRCHHKRYENAPDKNASTRRSYSKTQKRSNAHSPKRKRQKLISTGYSNFCSKLRVPNRSRVQRSRMTPQNSSVDELTVIGSTPGCRSPHAQSAKHRFALTTLDQTLKNASVME